MKQRLLQQLSFAKPLRLALVLSTLLLTLPQTTWGEEVTKTITFNKTVSTVDSNIDNSTMSVSIKEEVSGVSTTYDGEITISNHGIKSYSCSANGALFKMNGYSAANSSFDIMIPGNYPAKPSRVIVKAAYANGNTDYYFGIGVDSDSGNTYDYKLTTSSSNDNVEAEFTADGSIRTNRDNEGPLWLDFVINATTEPQSEDVRTTITVKEISITYTRDVYGITVAGTSVKSDNATDVLGDGKVSYNATTKTLKLDGANINYTSGDAITASTTDPLNVNVVGANSISCGDHKAFNTSGNLVFQTSGGVAPGQLTITSTSNIDPQSYYTCAGTVTYENDLSATSNGANSVIISCLGYELYIDGTQVTSGNASDVLTGTANAGKVSYDVTSNILTLDGVNLTMPIQTDIDNLIIELKGENKINTNAAENAIKRYSSNETLNLTIRPASTDPLGSINLANDPSTSTSLVDGFNLSLGGELFAYPSLNNSSTHNSYITSLLIGGQMVAKTGSVFSSHNKISFNNASNNNVLTLSGVTDELKYSKIISGLSNLTINFDGVNTIVREDTLNIITSTNSSSVLTFTKASDASSLTISNYSGEHSIIHGFNSINYGDGIYLAAPAPTTYINTPNIGLMSALDNTKPINSLLLSSDPTYQLWVAGTQATSTTLNGTGWTYDNDNKKLTLSGGTTFTGQIISGLGDLTIFLTGDNILQAAGSETSLIHSTNNGILSFDMDPAAIGSLAFKDNTGNSVFAGEPISGFTSKTYSNGLDYDATNKKIGVTTYNFSIGGVYITSASKTDVLGDGKVTYDPENHIFTLNDGTTITGIIEYHETDALTIALNGTSTITYTGGTYAINGNGAELTFVKAPNAADNTNLTITGNDAYVSISGFSNSTSPNMGTGIYWKPLSKYVSIITTDPDFVLYNGYAMTNGQTISDTQQTPGTVTYTESGSEKTLTFTNFQDAFGNNAYLSLVNAIETGVVGLKVILIGNNKITCNDNGALAFKSIQTNASIQFIKGGDGCKLTMDTKTANPLSFGDGKVTYDQLIYYSSNGNEKYICEPTAPTMVYNDQEEKVTLGKTYPDGDIYYTITYADGKTANVAKTKYTAEFALDAPGTVEAWVEANGATTSTVKGKHFGYQEAQFSLLEQEELTPVLIPAIETGDNIDYATAATRYAIDDANVATIDNNGKITALAIGAATLTTQLAYASNLPHTTTILNYDKKFTTQLTVSKVFNVTFAEGANYMIYYNSAHDNLTIPDGMTAAIVTGVASSGTTVETTALTYIPETTAVLLGKGTSTGSLTVTKYITKDPAPTGNKLKYVDNTPVTTTGYEYVLYKDEFVKATGSIPDGKCYLDLTGAAPAPAPARSLGIDNDGTTDIRELRMENEERDEWYDLQGRRIEQPTKAGLYIKNGKKVIVNTK